MNNIKIVSTANPDGSFITHFGGFDPTGKAVYKNEIFALPITNKFKPDRTNFDEAKDIIKIASEKLRR